MAITVLEKRNLTHLMMKIMVNTMALVWWIFYNICVMHGDFILGIDPFDNSPGSWGIFCISKGCYFPFIPHLTPLTFCNIWDKHESTDWVGFYVPYGNDIGAI